MVEIKSNSSTARSYASNIQNSVSQLDGIGVVTTDEQ